jgi:hypothetical protein
MSDVRDRIRNGLLVEGLGKPVDLNAVDWHVRHRNPSASREEIQNETLEIIRDTVSDGLFRVGSVSDKDVLGVAIAYRKGQRARGMPTRERHRSMSRPRRLRLGEPGIGAAGQARHRG